MYFVVFILEYMAVQVEGNIASNAECLCQRYITDEIVFAAGELRHVCGQRCAAQPPHQMKGGFPLNIVVHQSTAILQLLASKNEPLLVGRDAFLFLNFILHIINAVGEFHLQRDGLAGQRLDKELHGACAHAQGKAQHQNCQNAE